MHIIKVATLLMLLFQRIFQILKHVFAIIHIVSALSSHVVHPLFVVFEQPILLLLRTLVVVVDI